MGVLQMTSGDLPETATYAKRSWCYIPADSGEHNDGRIGTLTITLQRAARNGRATPTKVESDTYAIEADSEPLTGVIGRAFLLSNLTDPEQPDVYRTVIGPRCSCTCKAGLVRRDECKHVAALRDILAQEVLT
jgi:hypothetical protein